VPLNFDKNATVKYTSVNVPRTRNSVRLSKQKLQYDWGRIISGRSCMREIKRSGPARSIFMEIIMARHPSSVESAVAPKFHENSFIASGQTRNDKINRCHRCTLMWNFNAFCAPCIPAICSPLIDPFFSPEQSLNCKEKSEAVKRQVKSILQTFPHYFFIWRVLFFSFFFFFLTHIFILAR